MAQITTLSKLRFPLLALVLAAISATATAAPKIAEGAYRVDWNRKIRDLCVDNYTNDDLTARDWQGVLGALGSICTLSNVREGKTDASWTGKCSQPGVGRVLDVKYDVSVKVNANGSDPFSRSATSFSSSSSADSKVFGADLAMTGSSSDGDRTVDFTKMAVFGAFL